MKIINKRKIQQPNYKQRTKEKELIDIKRNTKYVRANKNRDETYQYY